MIKVDSKLKIKVTMVIGVIWRRLQSVIQRVATLVNCNFVRH